MQTHAANNWTHMDALEHDFAAMQAATDSRFSELCDHVTALQSMLQQLLSAKDPKTGGPPSPQGSAFSEPRPQPTVPPSSRITHHSAAASLALPTF